MNNIKREDLKVYAVTDRSWLGEDTLSHQVELAIQGGATFIQLREKKLDEESLYEEALEIQTLCKNYKVPFVLNDNVELALKMGADGVHVGQSDMEAAKVREILGPDKIIGVSAKTVEQALLAEKQGADYLGVGAVFPTTSKADATGVSMDTLREICKAVSIPVVAIGGITQKNVMELKGSSIAGVAVISAVFGQPDIRKAARELLEAVKEILESKKVRTALTIAGSDSCGGAGIQADIKTMTVHGVYAMSAITALTAQNTTGVSGIMEVTPEFLREQMEAVITDIRPDAVKVGMVSSAGLIQVIADEIERHDLKNVVVDPVIAATSGAKLLQESAIDVLCRELLPKADLITPNIPEAEILTGRKITSVEAMEQAAAEIFQKTGCAVLLKGGHQLNDANDFLYTEAGSRWFKGKRIDNPNTHGTGCTLSSAIASNLAKGCSVEEAVLYAKNYISGALSAMLDLGKGSGPMNHAFAVTGDYTGKSGTENETAAEME